MYKLRIDPKVALTKLRVIGHKQFVDSIPKQWQVDDEGGIRPQSICWLFVWAAIPNPNWGERLKVLFDEFMPFSFIRFRDRVGRDMAASLRYSSNDAEVAKTLARLMDSGTHDGPLGIELARAATKIADEGYFSPSTLEDERERRVTEIVERRGQADFRDKLIAAYEGRCAVTGSNAVAALEAAHIVPYCGPKSNHVSNGILLRCDIHTLFDLYLVEIDPHDLAITLGPALRDTTYNDLQGKRLFVPSDSTSHPSHEALVQRWRLFSRE